MSDSKQRMLREEWYLDDPTLREDRRKCGRLLDRFNALGTDDDEVRHGVLLDLFAAVGEDVVVMPRFVCSYGYQIRLGDRVFVNHDTLFMDDASITVADDVRIGPRVQLLTAHHPVEDHDRRREGWERPSPITIGANAWLGGGVIVCPGAVIGDEAVVGAGSVVTREVASRTLVAGNPARHVRDL